MITSKIHFLAIIKGVILTVLSLPLLFLTYKELVLWLTDGANIFFILMSFFGVFGVTFLVEGIRSFKQVTYTGAAIEERFFSFFKNKNLLIDDETRGNFSSKKYFGITFKSLIFEDKNGQQIKFHNFQYKNFNALSTTFQQKIKAKNIQTKVSRVDKVIIISFVAVTAWMVISALLNIIFIRKAFFFM